MTSKHSFICPNWNAPKNIQAFTTTKSIDLGLRNSNRDSVIDELLSSISKDKSTKINWLMQTHSTDIINLDTDYKTKDDNSYPEADASFTKNKNVIAAVLTADCLPVFITNKSGSFVAAIHAGWRGLVDGVIENTIKNIKESANDLIIWMGPAIGPKKFEVGEEVKKKFLDQAKNIALIESSFITSNLAKSGDSSEQKYLADLYLLAKDRLLSLNIPEAQIHYSYDNCTYSNEDKFHSYRRDKTTKRMASLIWIE